jgi:hypothetical protein
MAIKWLLGVVVFITTICVILRYGQQLTENDPAKAYMRRFHTEMAALTTSADSVRVATRFIRTAEDSVRTLHKDSMQLMKDVVNTIWITNNNVNNTPDWTKDKILRTAEVQPQFPGGDKALEHYLIDSINMRSGGMVDNNPQNGVYKVDFVVNLDGSLQDIEVATPNEPLKKLVTHAVRQMPKFKPGKYKGFDVRTHFRFSSDVKALRK